MLPPKLVWAETRQSMKTLKIKESNALEFHSFEPWAPSEDEGSN
jgi:hypothetical protein